METKAGYFVQEAKEKIDQLGIVSISYVIRSENKLAHELACMSIEFSE